mgnify:CR=1 FL=1
MEAHQDLVDSLYSHADQQLGFKKPPTLIFQSDPRNYGALSKTAQYDPSSQEITIYVDGRHIKDIPCQQQILLQSEWIIINNSSINNS